MDAKDLKIEFIPSGSSWFPVMNGVCITHIPSGLHAKCSDKRSVHANKEAAMKLLADLLEDWDGVPVEPVSIVIKQMKRIAELEQQNLELLAAIEAVQIDAEECLDFDERTAMLVPIDTYHALIEPAADLLAKRDQRRDAALLRKLSETFRKKENWGIDPIHYLLRLASECESGEWKL